MSKKAYFYIDDVVWPFRDITRNMPKSIFDQRLLKMLKEAHDEYGLKVTLNCFYRTDYFYGDDEFTLAEMTDAYKAEWEENSDWLKIGYHAKQEFPDYPHVNIEYDDMKNSYLRFIKEVKRFAGENVLMESINSHWWPISKDGCRALRDCGIKIFSSTYGETRDYNGDPMSLPYGHSLRLLQNRKPDTKIFGREGRDVAISVSLASYNHISEKDAEKISDNFGLIYDEELGIYFKKFHNGACLNLSPVDEIESDMAPVLGKEYVCCATHEQYAYPDYLEYQPETKDKIFKMCEIYKKHGYEYFFVDECLHLK